MTDTSENTNDWWGNLSAEQKLHIIEGIEDAENGRTISSEDFWDRLKN